MNALCLLLALVVTFGGKDREQFLFDGQPVQLRAGEIHPQRIPHTYWRHRIRMCKAMGLNAISSYFMWNDFEQPDGSFDFKTGNRDVAAFLRLCQEEKMYVLFRPGPYVCAEWDFGGIPSRFLKDGTVIRSTDPRYLKGALDYLGRIAAIAEPFLAKNGGPIVLTQIENEYGSWPFKEKEYLLALRDFWKARGFGPFNMADGAGDHYLKDLIYPDPEIAVGFDPAMDAKAFSFARKWNPGVPSYSAETYPGWLRHWGEGDWKPNDIRAGVKWLMENGKSFVFFVAHGGTSFGFCSGANDGGPGRYEPDLTSYDYGSPINEQGRATPEYYQYRELIGGFLGEPLPPVPEPIPTRTIAAFKPAFHAPLRANVGAALRSAEPMFFESFDQSQGMAIYATTIPAGKAAELEFVRISDYGQIYLDGTRVATVDRRLKREPVILPKRERPARLEIVVEAMGHVNYGRGMPGDRKGLLGPVSLGGAALADWTVRPKPLTEASVVAAKPAARDGLAGGHFRGGFTIDAVADTFIDMSKWTKGVVYVNGVNLGRYWNIGPQLSLYCPATFLRKGVNSIDVIELELVEPQPIRGLAESFSTGKQRETKNLNNIW